MKLGSWIYEIFNFCWVQNILRVFHISSLLYPALLERHQFNELWTRRRHDDDSFHANEFSMKFLCFILALVFPCIYRLQRRHKLQATRPMEKVGYHYTGMVWMNEENSSGEPVPKCLPFRLRFPSISLISQNLLFLAVVKMAVVDHATILATLIAQNITLYLMIESILAMK